MQACRRAQTPQPIVGPDPVFQHPAKRTRCAGVESGVVNDGTPDSFFIGHGRAPLVRGATVQVTALRVSRA